MAYRIKLGTFKLKGIEQEQIIIKQLISITETTPVDKDNPNKGFDFKEIRERGKIVDVLEAAEKADAKTVDLEDALYEKLKSIIENVSYATADRGLLTLIDSVLDAEKLAKKAAK